MKKEISISDSIKRILMTPIGSRIMNHQYGSNLHLLADRRIDNDFRLDLTQYVFEAISLNEPRAEVSNVKLIKFENGQLDIQLTLGNLNNQQVLSASIGV